MEFMTGYDIRVCEEADLAFLYRPVILEGPSETYLIGWGNKHMARGLKDWTQGGKDLHMFFFPAIEVELGINILQEYH